MNEKIIQNPNAYTKNRGLTKRATDNPLKVIDSDTSWARATPNEGHKKGTLINASVYQEFVPYQAKFETTKTNFSGLIKQTDKQHPWVINTEATWDEVINYPPSFKNDFNIDGWYADRINTQKELYEWKTDIFGNQYGLYKEFGTNLNPVSQYTKMHSFGDLWVNNTLNITSPATKLLSGIYVNHGSTVFAQLTSNQIVDMDVFYDTLMLVTPTYIVLDKIIMNYTTAEISSIADFSHTISLSGGKFSNIWFFEETKKVVFCFVLLTNRIPIPYLYELDLEENSLTKRFPLSNSNLTDLLSLSAYSLSGIDYPVFSYNNITKTYNIILYVNGDLNNIRDLGPFDWHWSAVKSSGFNPITWRQLKRTPTSFPARWFEATCEMVFDLDLGDSLLLINVKDKLNSFELGEVVLIEPVDLSNA